ncbi:MAG: amidohydrolase family protein [Ignavibacteriales bacterium]|nr:amidohydrolase family protein [Ignavibacteriales bacterium]
MIDSHCHTGQNYGLTGIEGSIAPLERYLIRAGEVGITKTILFSTLSPNYPISNREVARIVTINPNRFYGFVFVHAQRDRGRIHDMVKETVEQFGFCGIKVHRHDASITREVCEAARRFSLPILYDLMGEISQVEFLAQEYPDVSFIIPHLGSFGDDWKAQTGLIKYLVSYTNIYTDTSGVRRFDILEEAVHRAGAVKIIFGTDGPWLHPGVELSKIYALNLSHYENELILCRNILRLIKHTEVVASNPSFKYQFL